MTNLELERWTLGYTVQASDEEYTVETEGEFVFQDNTLSTQNDITPHTFRLHQNYPNPFNPSTTIEFYLPVSNNISLTVYNMVGQEVVSLVNRSMMDAGSHSIIWNGLDRNGLQVSSGTYIYELKFGNLSKVRQMTFMK